MNGSARSVTRPTQASKSSSVRSRLLIVVGPCGQWQAPGGGPGHVADERVVYQTEAA
jgi:hypothetical protein